MRAKDLDRRARAVALEGVLVEKHSAVMLDDHVKVLRQRTIGYKTSPFLYTKNMPRAVKVTSQSAGQNVSPDQGSTEGFVTCLTNPDCHDQDVALTSHSDVFWVGSGQASVRLLGSMSALSVGSLDAGNLLLSSSR